MRSLRDHCKFLSVRYSGFCPGYFDANVVRDHYNNRPPRRENFSHTSDTKVFRIVLPPPNVTGNLHIGHAVTVAIEDSFVRYHKLLGNQTVWYPGFDHAGIATQAVVEKQLFRETGKYRHEVPDADFLRYCEAWKNDRIKGISNQLHLLGADLDWPKVFYTMDERFSSVVATAFYRLFKQGLIFRQNRPVNWCPILQSTISDQEVEIIDNKKICARSGSVIEEIEKEQWFLRCDQLHHEVLSALRDGKIKVKPEQVDGKLIEWLNYSKPWCLSRQLLWGHRIPAFFDEISQKWFIAESISKANKECIGANLKQDPDVLDTWFSSSLIPLVVSGWPEKHVDGSLLEVMETGHDIIGFWVARMLILCKSLTGYFPFNNVVLHGMIRDSTGRKMSKSLGNVIDPLDVINGIELDKMLERLQKSSLSSSEIEIASADLRKRFPNGISKFGTDALRFAFLRHDLLSLDINLNIIESVNEGYRFCNKLWNVAKYTHKMCKAAKASHHNSNDRPYIEDIWLRSRLSSVLHKYHEHMSEFESHSAFNLLHTFILTDFCDIYLETTKPALWSNDPYRVNQLSIEISNTLTIVLNMLVPFMPLISSYLLNGLKCPNEYLLPKKYACRDVQVENDMKLAISVVSTVRLLRNELMIPKALQLQGILIPEEEDVCSFRNTYGDVILSLCNLRILSSVSSGYYSCGIKGTSMSLGISIQYGHSEKIREILERQLQTALHRKLLYEQTLQNAVKVYTKQCALNSNKNYVVRDIRKLDKTMKNAKKVIYGKTIEIDKLQRLLKTSDDLAKRADFNSP